MKRKMDTDGEQVVGVEAVAAMRVNKGQIPVVHFVCIDPLFILSYIPLSTVLFILNKTVYYSAGLTFVLH